MSPCDLDLWPADLESSWCIKRHVVKVCTKLQRNRTIPDWIIRPPNVSRKELIRHEPFGLLAWDILQKLRPMYERRLETYSNLHELKKAMRPKWNEVDGQTIKEDYHSISQHFYCRHMPIGQWERERINTQNYIYLTTIYWNKNEKSNIGYQMTCELTKCRIAASLHRLTFKTILKTRKRGNCESILKLEAARATPILFRFNCDDIMTVNAV